MESLPSQLKSDPPAASLDDLDLELRDEEESSPTVEATIPEWAESINARVDILESALFDHATILRDRVAERLDRLEATLDLSQQRMDAGLSHEARTREEHLSTLTDTFTRVLDRVSNESSKSTTDREIQPVRPATSDTLTDLVDALTATRTHLDTVATALQQTRTELSA